MSLHPKHKADLEKSGLFNQTIQNAQIKSVPPNEIDRRLGFPVPHVISAYEIPYPDGSSNFRCFYREGVEGEDSPKYLRPKGSRPIPYIPLDVLKLRNKTNVPVWITEGEKKSLCLIQYGEYVISISGVWNFKAGKDTDLDDQKDLWGVLKEFDWRGRTVFMAFDSDLWTNPQVRDALWEMSIRLFSLGSIVKFISWKPSEGKGIDDYLCCKQAQGKDIFQIIEGLKDKATPLEKFISPDHDHAILRALSKVDLTPVKYEQITKALSRKLGVDKGTVSIEINKRKCQADQKPPFSAAAEETALDLLKREDLIKLFLDECHKQYLGRDKELILIKLATISRKMKRGISVAITGTSSVGKSELVHGVLNTVWPEDKLDFTRVSNNYLLYFQEPLEHRVVTFFEIHGAADGSFYQLRSALTEGVLRLGTVISDKHKGLHDQSIEKSTDGMVLLTTFASGKIDHELRTRILVIELVHDEALAKEVLHHKAISNKPSDSTILIWRVADHLIEPLEVDVPYAPRLAELFPTNEERHMRDFDKVMNLIKASALFHQYQREQDDQGRVIATAVDYELVYGIRDLVTQSVSPISEHVRRFLETIQSLSSSGIDLTREQVRMQMNVSEPTIKRYVRTARESDFIETEGKGKRQMLKLIDIPEPASPLPKPETVFLPRDPVIQNDKVRDIQDFGPDHGSMIHRDPNDPSPGNEETITDQTGSNGSDPVPPRIHKGKGGIGSMDHSQA